MKSPNSILSHMPNQRAPHIKRTTITVDDGMYAWAMKQARKTGINDFSTFVRVLIQAERAAVETEAKPQPKPK